MWSCATLTCTQQSTIPSVGGKDPSQLTLKVHIGVEVAVAGTQDHQSALDTGDLGDVRVVQVLLDRLPTEVDCIFHVEDPHGSLAFAQDW